MRLIDADALEEGKFHGIEDWTPVESASWQRGWNDAIIAIINNAPTVDAEEVVRCKDCKWWQGEDEYCDYDLVGGPNDYCAWGERKDEID